MPERPPRVGELVEVRSRHWLVEAVETPAPFASPPDADDERAGLTDSDREAVACRFHFDLPWNPRIQFLSYHPVLFFRAPTYTIGYMSYLKR